MAEAPVRRRGRPPGSTNRPKLIASNPSPKPIEPTPLIGTTPGLATTVIVSSKRGKAFGEAPDEIEVAWPDGWRLPQVGEQVLLRKDWGGFVETVAFWPAERRVIVYLR